MPHDPLPLTRNEFLDMQAIEKAKEALDAAPVPDPLGYAHIHMTEEDVSRAEAMLEAERNRPKPAKLELKPYPIPLGAMLNAMYTRRSIDNRGKCQGKHVQARVARAQAKRAKKSKKPYTP